MIRHAIQIAVSIILVVVAVRQAVQLGRHRDDTALRALTAGLVSLALAKTLGMQDSSFPLLKSWLGPWAIVSINVWFISGIACFALFFLLANDGTTQELRARTARQELAVFAAAVLGGLVILTIVNTTGGWPPFPSRYRYWPSVLLDLLWSGYPIVIASVGVTRALRYRRIVEHAWLRRALLLVILGAIGQGIVVCGVSLAKTFIHIIDETGDEALFSILGTVYRIGLWGGQASFALGLGLPALAGACTSCAVAIDRHRQRLYRDDMLYLWCTLVEAFPFIVLHPDEVPARPNFTRCTAEIADGLSRLAPYYHHGPISGFDEGVTDPTVAADVVAAALEASARERTGAWRTTSAAADPPYPRLEPDLSGWHQRARWMRGVSQALRRHARSRYAQDAAINS